MSHRIFAVPAWSAVAVVLLMGLAAPASGQLVLERRDDLDFDRPESWAMKYFTSISLFTGIGVPRATDPGSIEVGIEGGWVPSLSERERTVGFNGTKTEDINRTSIFSRPRVRFGLPRDLAVTLSWVPPIEMFDVEPNLLAVAIERPLHDAESWRLGLRLYGQYGTLEGDFTCSEDDLAGPNPFRCEEPSNDEQTLQSASLEVSAAFRPGPSSRFEPYVALAAHWMDLEFQIDSRYNNIVDRTLLVTDGNTVSLTAGFGYDFGSRFRWSTEVFFTQLDVVRPPGTASEAEELVNVRSLLSYKVR